MADRNSVFSAAISPCPVPSDASHLFPPSYPWKRKFLSSTRRDDKSFLYVNTQKYMLPFHRFINLTQRGGAPFEQLTVLDSVKKFPSFYETQESPFRS